MCKSLKERGNIDKTEREIRENLLEEQGGRRG